MELSPKTYRHIVRPRWFSDYLFRDTIGRNFDFTNKDVLDFGCGIGTYCEMFHPKNYVGMDKNRDRIRYAKKIHPKYSFIQLNGNTLSLPDHSIDYIIIIRFLLRQSH